MPREPLAAYCNPDVSTISVRAWFNGWAATPRGGQLPNRFVSSVTASISSNSRDGPGSNASYTPAMRVMGKLQHGNTDEEHQEGGVRAPPSANAPMKTDVATLAD